VVRGKTRVVLKQKNHFQAA
jgi:hypothetical protein